MATKTCASLGEKRGTSLEPTSKNTRALRYDNLASVLIHRDEQLHVPAKRKRDRNSNVDSTEFAELLATIASLKAENERLAEKLTDEVERLTERLTELETRARRPWWRRRFGASRHESEPAGRPRRRAVARLRALYLNRSDLGCRPT